jgi:hypothetical protein
MENPTTTGDHGVPLIHICRGVILTEIIKTIGGCGKGTLSFYFQNKLSNTYFLVRINLGQIA